MNKYADWRLWAHYVALTGMVFLAHSLSGSLESGPLWKLFVYYVLAIGLSDIMIHMLWAKLFNWRD